MDRSAPPANGALDEAAVIGFKGSQGGVEQVTLGDDDDIEPWRDLVATENLSNQAFRTVSLNRPSELPGGRDPQTARPELVR